MRIRSWDVAHHAGRTYRAAESSMHEGTWLASFETRRDRGGRLIRNLLPSREAAREHCEAHAGEALAWVTYSIEEP